MSRPQSAHEQIRGGVRRQGGATGGGGAPEPYAKTAYGLPTDLGLSVGTTFVDERPPLQPGKPEVRTYEQIYVRGNQPVGQWSDAVRVTLQP